MPKYREVWRFVSRNFRRTKKRNFCTIATSHLCNLRIIGGYNRSSHQRAIKRVFYGVGNQGFTSKKSEVLSRGSLRTAASGNEGYRNCHIKLSEPIPVATQRGLCWPRFLVYQRNKLSIHCPLVPRHP